MSDFIRTKKARMIVGCIALVIVVLALAVYAMPKSGAGNKAVAIGNNSSAVRGTLTTFQPGEHSAADGKSIEGSDEEKLQQERIAGGAVAGPVSKNLAPLNGVTDYSQGGYVDSYGMNEQPSAIGHGNRGPNCLSCHSGGGPGTKAPHAVAQMPQGHVMANLEDADCVTCHKAR